MKRRLWLLILALCGAGMISSAQTTISVLEIEPGVQALGLGAAGVSLGETAETLYYNPAALAGLAGISFGSSYAVHLGLANYSAFGLTFRNWGLGFLSLGSGDIPGYDEEDGSTDPLSYGSSAFLFGFGLKPSDLPFLPKLPIDFAVGGRLKYLSLTSGTVKGSGFGVDLAYRMTFPNMRLGPIALSGLAVGVTATNLLSSVAYDGGHTERLRMSIRAGGSSLVSGIVLVATDLDLGGSVHVGTEYRPAKGFAVRAGLMTQPGGIAVTLGLGVDVSGFVVDYAFQSHPELGATHRVSLTLDFSAIDLTAISRSLGRLIR